MVKDQFERTCEQFYYISLFLYLLLLFVMQTELRATLSAVPDTLLKYARYCCFLMFGLKVVLMPLYKRQYLLPAMVGLPCALLCAYLSGDRRILFIAVAVIAAYGCDTKTIMKVCVSAFSLGFALTLLLCSVGVFQNRVLDEVRNRHNLGFNWVTLASIYWLFITIGYTWIREKGITFLEILLMEAVCFFLFYETDTRLTFIVNTLFLAIVLIEKYVFRCSWPFLSNTGYWFCVLPIVLMILVVVVQILYTPDHKAWETVNSLLSGRLSQTEEQFNTLPITLFGQKVEWVGQSLSDYFQNVNHSAVSNNVDSSYLRIFFDYGVAGVLIGLSLYMIGIYKAVAAREYFLLLGYITVLLFCVTEQWMLELSFNPFPLFAFSTIAGHSSPGNPAGRRRKILFRQKQSDFK